MPSYKPAQTCDWETALTDYLLHVEAVLASNTRSFYGSQLNALRSWAEAESIAFDQFGKRHLDR